MDVKCFSQAYRVSVLGDKDARQIYELCKNNKLYYEYCPPFVTIQSIKNDLRMLPKEKNYEDKYYVGFYEADKLIAVMDFIDGYPNDHIAYIGFFMTDISVQKCGVGTKIMEQLCSHLAQMNYSAVQLAWVKGNPQAEYFWKKNYFIPFKETKSNVADEVILAERILK